MISVVVRYQLCSKPCFSLKPGSSTGHFRSIHTLLSARVFKMVLLFSQINFITLIFEKHEFVQRSERFNNHDFVAVKRSCKMRLLFLVPAPHIILAGFITSFTLESMARKTFTNPSLGPQFFLRVLCTEIKFFWPVENFFTHQECFLSR